MEAVLQRIYDEENAPSAYQLYKLARKAGHAYTKAQVDRFVKNQAAAQILTARKAPGRVTGKFQSTRQGEKSDGHKSFTRPARVTKQKSPHQLKMRGF